MEGEGAYFDGLRPVRRAARLALAPKALMLSVDGGAAFAWPYDAIRRDASASGVVRLRREASGADTGEALELAPGPFAEALLVLCHSLAGSVEARRRTRNRILGWSAAAVVSLAALIFWGVPALATRLAALVPWSTEVALGEAVEGQVLRELGGTQPRFCGADARGPGAEALSALVARLSAHAALPGPLKVRVLDSPVQNAFALPGGRIVFMRGLIERARSPDEVAGVLAHEMGHVANRDAMRGIIHAGGISMLIGTLLGDFTGAGALVIASRFLLTTRHSREVERQADLFAIDVMTRAGGDVRSLAGFLQRVAADPAERQLAILLTHPVTADRVAEIERRAPAGPARPLLSPEEWAALRRICRDG